MEGLIPLVCKAIKRNIRGQKHRRSLSVQTPYFFVDDDVAPAHRQYTSTTAAAAVHGSATQSNYLYITPPAVNIQQINATTDHRLHHRRHKSVSVVGDRVNSFGIAEELDQGSNYYNNNNQQMTKVNDRQRAKQLVRFRSHRSSLFSSCISGAV